MSSFINSRGLTDQYGAIPPESQYSPNIETDLEALRRNVDRLEQDLKRVEKSNSTNIRERQVESNHVANQKEELRRMKMRINMLLKTEKEKVRELNDSMAKAQRHLRNHQKVDARVKSGIKDPFQPRRSRTTDNSTMMDASRYDYDDLDNAGAKHHRYQDQDDLFRAQYKDLKKKQGIVDEMKEEGLDVKRRAREKETQAKIKNMQNVIKMKMYKISADESQKNQQLLRKLMTKKRLEKDKDANVKKITKAAYLMNFSTDIEHIIKSNIEMAIELKQHYDAVFRAGGGPHLMTLNQQSFEASPHSPPTAVYEEIDLDRPLPAVKNALKNRLSKREDTLGTMNQSLENAKLSTKVSTRNPSQSGKRGEIIKASTLDGRESYNVPSRPNNIERVRATISDKESSVVGSTEIMSSYQNRPAKSGAINLDTKLGLKPSKKNSIFEEAVSGGKNLGTNSSSDLLEKRKEALRRMEGSKTFEEDNRELEKEKARQKSRGEPPGALKKLLMKGSDGFSRKGYSSKSSKEDERGERRIIT